MALLSLTMKSSHHHPGSSEFLEGPPSPPLSSPSPSSVSGMAAVSRHDDDDFRSSLTTLTAASSCMTSDNDRPLKKRRKQERPSLFVDHRSPSNNDHNETTDLAMSTTTSSRANNVDDDDAEKNYAFVWNELAATNNALRLSHAELSPEVPARDGSDKENDVATNHVVTNQQRNCDDDDENEIEKSDAAAAIDFRQAFDRLNGRVVAADQAGAECDNGSMGLSHPSSLLPGMTSMTGGLSSAGSMLLRQLVFQNPLLASSGQNVGSLPAITTTPSSPSQYGLAAPAVAAAAPRTPSQTLDPFAGGKAASDDGEGVTDDGDGGPETCPECQKVFKRRVYLQRHMAREHWSTARVFKCDKCAYETKHQSNLLVHRRTHTGKLSIKVLSACHKFAKLNVNVNDVERFQT